jgi:hypothetical protein
MPQRLDPIEIRYIVSLLPSLTVHDGLSQLVSNSAHAHQPLPCGHHAPLPLLLLLLRFGLQLAQQDLNIPVTVSQCDRLVC